MGHVACAPAKLCPLINVDVTLALLAPLPHTEPIQPNVLDRWAHCQVLLNRGELHALGVGWCAFWLSRAVGKPAMADGEKLVGVLASASVIKVHLYLDDPAARLRVCEQRLQRGQRFRVAAPQHVGEHKVVLDAGRRPSGLALDELQGLAHTLRLAHPNDQGFLLLSHSLDRSCTRLDRF